MAKRDYYDVLGVPRGASQEDLRKAYKKLARKHQNVIVIKEIKLRPKVGVHDYETKKGHVVRFLKNHDKVKVTIMFRGREMTHPEKGRELLLRLADDLKEIAVIESEPLQDGRNMVMMLAPSKALLKEGAPETAAKEADEEFEQNLELLRRTEAIVERIERMERVVLAISDAVLREVVPDDEEKRRLDASARQAKVNAEWIGVKPSIIQ